MEFAIYLVFVALVAAVLAHDQGRSSRPSYELWGGLVGIAFIAAVPILNVAALGAAAYRIIARVRQ